MTPEESIILLTIGGRDCRLIATAHEVKDELLAALRSAGFRIVQDWRPIESAPKDGTRILVRVEHINFTYAETPEERARWEEVCAAHWIDHNGGGWTWHGVCGTPTHWRPLPESPK